MASSSSISSIYPHVISYKNKAASLKAFFTYGFDIQIINPNLFDMWVTHKFNICTTINVKDYELWTCILMDFKKFEVKYFNILDSNI